MRAEKSYPATMKNLQEIVSKRLEQLGIGPVEAATAAGLERTFIRDIVEHKKQSVRAESLPALARALSLDLEALIYGKLVPANSAAPKVSGEEAVKDLLRRIDGLPEEAINPLWLLIEGYLRDAARSAQSQPADQPVSATPRRELAR